jgi:hypothetical protein
MTEREKAALLYVLLTYVKEIHDGKSVPTLQEIQARLQQYGT